MYKWMYLAEFDCVQRIINLFEFIIFSYFAHLEYKARKQG